MNNNVVDALWRALPPVGMLAFRFNFRGVGGSEGRFEKGIGETRDVKGALRFLSDAGYGGLPSFLAGYSFGAYVIHLMAALPNSRGIIMVSPPVSMMAFDPGRLSEHPFLFVSGDQDAFCRPRDLDNLVSALEGDIKREVFPGVDHFWLGKEGLLVETVRSWIESRLTDVS